MRAHAEHLIVLGSGVSAHARTDGPSRWCAICLPKQEFARYAHALTGGVLRLPEGVSCWHARSAALRELHAIHVEAMRSVRIASDTFATSEGGHGLEQQLIHALVECLSEPTRQISGGRPQADGIVRRTVADRAEPRMECRRSQPYAWNVGPAPTSNLVRRVSA